MIILRNLWRNRLYSGLNITGLAISMSAVVLIALWVQNELRFDQYHRNVDLIYRIHTDLKISDTETWYWGNTPLPIAKLLDQTPGVAFKTQIFNAGERVVHRGNESFRLKDIAYAGEGWFDLFTYEVAEGSIKNFGQNPNEAIITEKTAEKIFGRHSALGNQITIDSTDFVVQAVIRNPRPESSFRDDVILPVSAWLKQRNNRENDESWNNFNYSTFVELRPEAVPADISQQLTQLLAVAKEDSSIVLHLEPLTAMHFDQSLKDDVYERGNIKSVWAFGLIGALILLMAAMNYISLTTARAQVRAREIGIRKLVGADKSSLFGQFLKESGVLALIAGAIALLIVYLTLPWFNDLADRNFTLNWTTPLPWLLFGGTIGVSVLLSGIYPALLLAGFQPMKALRGQLGRDGRQRSVFRQGLVVVQFTVSIALLICTIVIEQQRAFIQQKNMGYDRAQTLNFGVDWEQERTLGHKKFLQVRDALLHDLSQQSTVVGVSLANQSPVHIKSTHSGSVKFDGLPEDAHPTVSQLSADARFKDVLGLQMKEGRWFEENNISDLNNVVLNETAARQLGLPQPWLGQRFGFQDREGQVVGIVQDFHFKPLHTEIVPLVVFNNPEWRREFFVKIQPGQTANAIAAVERIWKNYFPGQPINYTFLDEQFEKMYRTEQRAGALFRLFAGIAIFIACLGLFGLATFVATQRTKEIGIRKVLGASVAGITGLLAKDFLWLVVIATMLASPLAWLVMQEWLSSFAYRIGLQWWMFAGAGALAVLIAGCTIGIQSIRAARANPVNSLRSE